MPPPPGAGAKKKKKGRAPKHQNAFAFRHNPKSKKTEKILSSPNVGVCRRCYDKIEWRKKYRKYKPRTQLGKCNMCFQKNITAAYHTICPKCAASDKAIAAMEKRGSSAGAVDAGDSNDVISLSTSENNNESATSIADENNETMVNESNEEDRRNTTVAPVATIMSNEVEQQSKRKIRVCAVCTNEPALSKYSGASPEDEDIIDRLQELEDTLDSGVDKGDGHKLTLREVKGLERKIEKLQAELKERRKERNKGDVEGDEEQEEENESADEGQSGEEGSDQDSEESVEGNRDGFDDNANDPFLLATGGKALVGEEYQKILLAREQQK